MKVILNKDVNHLGEEGDVKVVANGFARNYLLPRGLVLPYTPEVVALFESRKADIEARKAQKRQNSASLKEKLEALEMVVEMPAGSNGKLYGAVTTQTLTDLFAKQGFEIERKRIEIPGLTLKNTGHYHVTVRLYEAQTAQVSVTVKAQGGDAAEAKAADKKADAKKERQDKPAEDAPAEKAE